MKPTPTTRLSWLLLIPVFAIPALVLWGCGHTREIIYPGRKVSPPRSAKSRHAQPNLERVAPGLEAALPAPKPRRQPDAPTAIDVPIINRHDR